MILDPHNRKSHLPYQSRTGIVKKQFPKCLPELSLGDEITKKKQFLSDKQNASMFKSYFLCILRYRNESICWILQNCLKVNSGLSSLFLQK